MNSNNEPVPAWLADAVAAAGMCVVYNAEDWDRLVAGPSSQYPTLGDLPPLPH